MHKQIDESHLVVSSIHFKHRDVAPSVDLLALRLLPLTVRLEGVKPREKGIDSV